MIGAFAFLWFQSWKNRLVTRVRRLKQPKYLMGAVVGGLYFYWYFYRYLLNPHRLATGHGLVITPEMAAWLEPLIALAFFLVILLGWLIPRNRAALVFTEAEVAFLFPAPVSRRTLIHYKLFKSQFQILMTILFLMIFFGRFFSGGSAWLHAISWWVMLSTYNLHTLGASFTLTLLTDKNLLNWKTRTATVLLVVAALAGVGLWIYRAVPLPDLRAVHDLADLQDYFESAVQTGPLFYILYPFRLLVRPYLQTNLTAFGAALIPALLILAIHYVWVVKLNVAFEEASVEASKKMAERVASIRANRGQFGKPKKKKRSPFKLNPTGLPAIAILWKNLIGTGQFFNLRRGIFIIVFVAVLASRSAGSHHGPTVLWVQVVGMLAFILLAMSFLVGSQLVRQDFRQDLSQADVLKSFPLKGWQVALGELSAPLAILTVAQWLLIIICSATTADFGLSQLSSNMRIGAAVGLALLAPGWNLVTLIIPNAAVLLFPGWFQSGKDSPRGIEATGQRLIFAVGQLLVVIIALLPAAVVFLAAFYGLKVTLGMMPLALAVGAAGAAVVLLLEAALGILWLGKLFEGFDVADSVANQN